MEKEGKEGVDPSPIPYAKQIGKWEGKHKERIREKANLFRKYKTNLFSICFALKIILSQIDFFRKMQRLNGSYSNDFSEIEDKERVHFSSI
jgi:hypothetical protein